MHDGTHDDPRGATHDRRAGQGPVARPRSRRRRRPPRSLVFATVPGPAWTTRSSSGFARAIADEGVATLRFNFPYMEAGKRSPDRPPIAVATRGRRVRGGDRSRSRRRARLHGRQVVRRAHGLGRGRRGRARGRAGVPRLSAAPAGQARPRPRRAPLRASTCRCCSCRARRIRSPRRRCSSPCSRSSATATHVAIEGGGHSLERSRGEGPARGRGARSPPWSRRSCAGTVPDAAEASTRSRLLPSLRPRRAGVPVRRADLGPGARLRDAERRWSEGLPMPRVRSYDPRRRPAPGRGARRRSRRPPSLAHRVLAPRAPAPGTLSTAGVRDVVGAGGYDCAVEPEPADVCTSVSESKRPPCDACGHPMEPEHAHDRCPACHYILPCCGW